MGERQKIFVAYCFADKKWLDRVQPAIAPLAAATNLVVWDERKLQGSRTWPAELANHLASSRLAILLVSDLFMESDFVRRAKLPALIKEGRAGGLRDCWILASHCHYAAAALDESLAANDLNRPIDSLSVMERDGTIAAISARLRSMGGIEVAPPAPSEASSKKTRKAPASVAVAPVISPIEPLPPSPYTGRLGAVVETRADSLVFLRRLANGLFVLSLAVLAFSIAVVVITSSVALFFLVAGFGILIASMVFVLRRRMDFLSESIIGMRYLRTGLADATLPERQRTAIMRKADEILGAP
jgi:hypothetical protein